MSHSFEGEGGFGGEREMCTEIAVENSRRNLGRTVEADT